MKDSLFSDPFSDATPGYRDAYSRRRSVQASARELPGGRERVLVVDDNRTLAESTRRLLADLGYDTLACNDPLQALTLFDNPLQGSFDLLLTDYAMPQMSGYQLAMTLRKSEPTLRVLLCSAWPEDVIRQDHPENDWLPFLEKPFTLEVLASTVRRVLDDHSSTVS